MTLHGSPFTIKSHHGSSQLGRIQVKHPTSEGKRTPSRRVIAWGVPAAVSYHHQNLHNPSTSLRLRTPVICTQSNWAPLPMPFNLFTWSLLPVLLAPISWHGKAGAHVEAEIKGPEMPRKPIEMPLRNPASLALVFIPGTIACSCWIACGKCVCVCMYVCMYVCMNVCN